MSQTINREFGSLITRLIQKENLTRNESKQAFVSVLNNDITHCAQISETDGINEFTIAAKKLGLANVSIKKLVLTEEDL